MHKLKQLVLHVIDFLLFIKESKDILKIYYDHSRIDKSMELSNGENIRFILNYFEYNMVMSYNDYLQKILGLTNTVKQNISLQ